MQSIDWILTMLKYRDRQQTCTKVVATVTANFPIMLVDSAHAKLPVVLVKQTRLREYEFTLGDCVLLARLNIYLLRLPLLIDTWTHMGILASLVSFGLVDREVRASTGLA